MIYVIGIGPGNEAETTPRAEEALKRSDVIVGYDAYVELIRGRHSGKELLTTPMRRELERCEMAVTRAKEGKTVSVVCSGDAGVYGLAGVVLEFAEKENIPVEVIPGVTAASAAAAVLGAPLIHDFAVISLSDILTPWELIEKRLRAAASADFVVCFYNPRSHRRKDHLKTACNVILEQQSPDTVCGWVKNAGRDGMESKITRLGALGDEDVDMFTTVIVGNSSTKALGSHMVTPRGYHTDSHLKSSNSEK